MSSTLEQISSGELTAEGIKDTGLRPLEPHEVNGDGAREIIVGVARQGKRIVGPRMKALRLARRLDLATMAKLVGLNKSTLQRYESHDDLAANHPALNSFAVLFDITVEDLTEGSEVPLLTPDRLGVINSRVGKVFPNQKRRQPASGKRIGRPPRTPASPRDQARHAAYETDKQILGKRGAIKLGEMPSAMLRTIITTFNAERMKGQTSIQVPIDVFQAMVASLLQARRIDPEAVIITADFAAIFNK